jgi:hypothetical protein
MRLLHAAPIPVKSIGTVITGGKRLLRGDTEQKFAAFEATAVWGGASISSGAVVPGRLAGASRHKAIGRKLMPAFRRRAARDDRPTEEVLSRPVRG